MMLLIAALSACTELPVDTSGAPDACGEPSLAWEAPAALPRDGELHLGQLQAAATHNSYHVASETPVDPSHAYTQPPLDEQLAAGFRGLELDVHLREDGGVDVFHLPALDAGTTCATLAECLYPICTFSAQNPGHAPLMIWLEPKDDVDAYTPGYDPLLGRYDALEAEILAWFPRERLYTPDDWARGEADAGAATRALGPPLLEEVRGKLLFGLLDSAEHRDAYTADDPALAGRLLFPDSSDASAPYAALVKDADPASLVDYLGQGLVVTATADSVDDADAEAQANRDALMAGGAHWIATDLPAPVEGRDYWLDWPTDGGAVRCNPATAPADCAPGDLEAL